MENKNYGRDDAERPQVSDDLERAEAKSGTVGEGVGPDSSGVGEAAGNSLVMGAPGLYAPPAAASGFGGAAPTGSDAEHVLELERKAQQAETQKQR